MAFFIQQVNTQMKSSCYIAAVPSTYKHMYMTNRTVRIISVVLFYTNTFVSNINYF